MKNLNPDQLYADPTTTSVREQLGRIYEDTGYVIAGSLGRTAVMGKEPNYWYRSHGELRDIDVLDPDRLTPEAAREAIDGQPLPLDVVSSRWLRREGDEAVLSLPRDPSVAVSIPGSYFEIVENSLLGVPVRSFRPEIMLGLNIAVPYARIRQRAAVGKFDEWVRSRPDFDPKLLEPFQDMAEAIRQRRPDYPRDLRRRDIVGQLPTPLYKLAKAAYRHARRLKNGE